MDEIFSNCPLLISLPNITKWNTDKLIKSKKMSTENFEIPHQNEANSQSNCLIF